MRAVCDPEAFYPLRSLVAGPFTDLAQLPLIECFIRTVLLHDEISMELEPRSAPLEEEEPELTEEEQREGGRLVITAFGPVRTGYDFFTDSIGPQQSETPNLELSQKLVQLAREFSDADEGSVYFDAHINYLRRILGIVQSGAAL